MAEPPDERTAFQVDRLAFFSDAVFAIAITLLVFNVHPPTIAGEVTEAALRQALVLMLPAVIGFVLSFVVIGTYWRAHHRLFRWVRNYDNRLVSINLRLLLCVSFIPCPTAFYSQYPNAQTPLIFYCASLAVAGLASYQLWRYLQRSPNLLDPATPSIEFLLASRRSLILPVTFLTAGTVSLFNPWFARGLMIAVPFLLVPLYFRALRRRHARLTG